ncbi:hypothetical protein COV24_03870 [candidate division WWE3 bacterium CG10_big_fil_rev_8_21_14_0_10_32_10]|uniref:Uncharacterized protein n=1 Tax=candidate division WWE3 bacterium CG10_big_fil_rev_8_21_14_0_10_32_10 TaxID=1975090 RepID=A0A2H0R9L4_UNCKA|nr:MAG: hypothetical protein COV24_03870 [candidate division WWE3 bacterium CG10_big_fil_rev_8_21_14_0_10_32_10]
MSIVLIVSSLLNLIIGIVVFSLNKKNKINQFLALTFLFIAIYNFSGAFYRDAMTESSVSLWAIVANISGIFIAPAFFYFTVFFPYQKYKLTKLHNLVAAITSLGVIVFSFYWIEGAKLVEPTLSSGNAINDNLPARVYFLIFILAFSILNYFNLFTKLIEAKEFAKKQLTFVTFGSLPFAIIGSIIGGILPYWNMDYFYLSPLSTSVFALVVAYFLFIYPKRT